MRLRLLAGGLALATVAVGAAAVVASSGGTAQAAVRRAAGRTLDSGSSRLAITYSSEDGRGEAHGMMDYVDGRGSISFDESGVEATAVFDGPVVYVRPGIDNFLPADKPWLRIEDEDARTLELPWRALRDPATLLGFLRMASSEVRESGHEIVRGEATTHYEGTLDLEKVVEQAPPDERASLDHQLEDRSATVRYGIWVDDDGLTRRLRVDDQDSGSGTIEFFDYGVPVHIELPPATATIGVDDLFQVTRQPDCGGHEGSAGSSSGDSGSGYTVHVCSFGTSVATHRGG